MYEDDFTFNRNRSSTVRFHFLKKEKKIDRVNNDFTCNVVFQLMTWS